MKVEDEKKLVAEKLMGWKVGKRPPFPDTVLIYRIGCFPDTNVNVLEPEHWNPQTDRNAWDEIWEKLRFYTRENEICANTYLDFVFPVGKQTLCLVPRHLPFQGRLVRNYFCF